jgi:hypothetical protein
MLSKKKPILDKSELTLCLKLRRDSMKKVIICLLLFALPGISYPANENKREIVEELLALNNAESIIDNIYLQIVLKMKDEMSWDKMKEPVIQAYLKRYSKKEIQDQIAFYKSDPGQSMKNKQAKLMTDTIMLLNREILKNFRLLIRICG